MMPPTTSRHTAGWYLRRISIPAERDTDVISNRAVMRSPIRRIREDARARRRRRRAPRVETRMVGRRQREPLGPKRVAVHLAHVIADLTGARVGVLELQDRLADLAVLGAHLEGAPVVDGEVGFAVGACAGGEGVDGAAGGASAVVFALAADVKVNGEAAVVADVGGADGAGGGVDGGDGRSAGDERGVGDIGVYGGGRGVRLGTGMGWKGEVAKGNEGGDDGG